MGGRYYGRREVVRELGGLRFGVVEAEAGELYSGGRQRLLPQYKIGLATVGTSVSGLNQEVLEEDSTLLQWFNVISKK